MASIIVAGSTGACGREVVRQAVLDPSYARIVALSRKEVPQDLWPTVWPGIDIAAAKGRLEPTVVDWEDMCAQHRHDASAETRLHPKVAVVNAAVFKGHDVAVMSLGTTRGDAGSAKNFRRVDFGYAEAFALSVKSCSGDTLKHYAQVSASNANASSYLLYPKTKGEADEMALSTGLPSVSIFRPGLLDRGGKSRFIEKIAGLFMSGINMKELAAAILFDAKARATDRAAGAPLRSGATPDPHGRSAGVFYSNKAIRAMGAEAVAGKPPAAAAPAAAAPAATADARPADTSATPFADSPTSPSVPDATASPAAPYAPTAPETPYSPYSPAAPENNKEA